MEGISTEEGLEKFCSKCKSLVPIECFHKDVTKRDGLKYVCKDCLKIASKVRYQKQKADSKRNGMCIRYGCKVKPSDGSWICETHFYQSVSLNTLKNKVSWIDLERLAQQQKYTCPLTGDKLIAGVNMSLDHIKPISRFPELGFDVDNLQWLTKWANVSKSNLDLEEFIANCFKVTRRVN